MFTYLIYDTLSGLTKVGKTRNVKSRLSTLSTGNLNLNLLLSTEGDFEKEFHTLFKDKKVEKEWFKLSHDDIEAVEEIVLWKNL